MIKNIRCTLSIFVFGFLAGCTRNTSEEQAIAKEFAQIRYRETVSLVTGMINVYDILSSDSSKESEEARHLLYKYISFTALNLTKTEELLQIPLSSVTSEMPEINAFLKKHAKEQELLRERVTDKQVPRGRIRP